MRKESVMKWNEKERKRKESESYPGMIGNDCENDRKRLQYLPSVLPLRGMDSSEIPLFSVHFPQKKYPRCGKHRGVWLFFILCCIFLWEYWWYFVEYKNYRQADHRCHTDSYCSIVMTIHC